MKRAGLTALAILALIALALSGCVNVSRESNAAPNAGEGLAQEQASASQGMKAKGSEENQPEENRVEACLALDEALQKIACIAGKASEGEKEACGLLAPELFPECLEEEGNETLCLEALPELHEQCTAMGEEGAPLLKQTAAALEAAVEENSREACRELNSPALAAYCEQEAGE